ncbi:MAG: hypothetical protein AAGH65_10725, partial [Pseudomonadota bacterium]
MTRLHVFKRTTCGFVCGLMLFTAAHSTELNGLHFQGLKQQAERQFFQLEQSVIQQLRTESLQSLDRTEKALRADPLPGDVSSSLFNAVMVEPDLLRREALISLWLDREVTQSNPAATSTEALQTIAMMEPVIMIPHHEMFHHYVPAFQLAKRAENQLQRQLRHDQALTLLSDPDGWVAAYSEPSGSERFKTAALAFRYSTTAQQSALIDQFHHRLESMPEAAQALVSMISLSAPDFELQRDIITIGDVSSARQVLLMASSSTDAKALAERALERPEIGGVAIQIWLEHGGIADQRLWPMLADPHLGADVAAALA